MLLRRTLPPLFCLTLSCVLGGDGTSTRMTLGLTGQFLPGELAVLDLDVYDGEAVSCVDGRRVEGDTTARVESRTGISLPSDPVELTLDAGAYVVRARAGLVEDLSPGGEPLAEGCAAVTVEGGRAASANVPLYRGDRCGDGNLDVVEQCDDGNRAVGDGCDGSCRTEVGWVNQDVAGNQMRPRAAGEGNLVATCWQSDLRSNDEAPMRWLDRNGVPRDVEFYQSTETRQDCTDLDVLDGAVLMTSLRGEVDARWPYITMWNSSLAALPQVQGGEAGDLDITADFLGTGEAVVAVVRPGAAAGQRQVLAGLFRMQGGAIEAVGEAVPVDESGTVEDQESPAIAGGPDGQFIVAFRGSLGKIWARVFDGLAGPGTLLRLYDGPGTCGAPAVARLGGSGSGRYVVVFSEGEYGRIVARIVTAGSVVSSPIAVNDVDRSGDPDVAAFEDGFVIVWAQPSGGTNDIYARVLDGVDGSGAPVFGYIAEGTEVTSEPLLVNASTTGSQDQPAVGTTTIDGETTAIILWREGEGDDGDDIARRQVRVVRPPAG